MDALRNVAVRQRDLDDDGEGDGTLGVQIGAGNGAAFEAFIDQVGLDDQQDETSQKTTARIVPLPWR